LEDGMVVFEIKFGVQENLVSVGGGPS